jgi:hypothetical protein
VLAVALGIPALMLAGVLVVCLIGLLGALPVMLVWNHGLTTFLEAANLGSVDQVGFWSAFWLSTLAAAVGGIIHRSGSLPRKD